MNATTEKYAEAITKVIINGDLFKERVAKLASVVCDELVYELATEFRQEAENDLQIAFPEGKEDEHYEFAMVIEGDLRRAILNRLHKLIGEY